MRKISIALALVMTATSATAFAKDDSVTFERDGTAYSYTVSDLGKLRIIKGKTSEGTPFRLYVSENRVRGTYNGTPVSFPRDAVPSVTIAQR